MSTPTTIAQRLKAAVQRRGATIALRRVSTSAAPGSLSNPPILISPVIDGAPSAGATVIAIRANDAQGRMINGDRLVIAGTSYRVTQTAEARDFDTPTAGFDNVHISPGLRANVADGTSVTPAWIADEKVPAIIQAYPQRLVDGTLITARDLELLIPSHEIDQPELTDLVLIGDDLRSIVSVQPIYTGSTIVQWRVQAR